MNLRYVVDKQFRAIEWRKNDWRNHHGEPRENADLWKEFLSSLQKCRVRLDVKWTAGKKSPILRTIDKAAKAATQRGGTDKDHGFRAGAISRSMVKGAATKFNAQGQIVVIRPYRKNVMKGGENKIRFDIFSDQTRSYTESCYAYASPALTAQLHRQRHYRVQFNNDSRYPQMIELMEEVHIPTDADK